MIIFRYITKEVLATMLVSTFILLIIFITNQSVQFLDRIAMGQLPATVLLKLIALQIPLLLGYLLPLSLYLGILLTYSRMHLESEMTVLSCCGVSRAKLIGIAFTIAVFVAAIVAWLMADVVPKAQGGVNYIFDKAAVTASVGRVIPARFMTFSSHHQPLVFYADHVQDHKSMQNVFLATRVGSQVAGQPSPKEWAIVYAKHAFEGKVPGQEGRFLIFENGYRYEGSPAKKDYQVLGFDRYGIRLTTGVMPHFNAVQYYSVAKLWSLIDTDKSAVAELQWRLAMPISTIIFALIAVPLCEIKPRYGKMTQLFPAMLIFLTYADLMFLARDWIRFGKISGLLGMWWIHGLALLLAILLILYRVGWRRICLFFKRQPT